MSEPTVWEGCYEKRLTGFITAESFNHPAKFSLGLIERIFEHCLERGYFRRGDIVGDCFGGVGTGLLVGAYRGLRMVGVELEPKFVGMAIDNFEKHREYLVRLGCPAPLMIKGDSRRFNEHVEAAGIVSSPPYNKPFSEDHNGKRGGHRSLGNTPSSEKGSFVKYGHTEGQIEGLNNGSVDSVVSSPPYADSHREQKDGIDWTKAAPKLKTSGCHQAAGASCHATYGQEEGQIGRLKSGNVDAVVSSPPFTTDQPCASQTKALKDYDTFKAGESTKRDHQMQSEGNISALKAGAIEGVVTPPPWEANSEGSIKASKVKFVPHEGNGHYGSPEARARQLQRDEEKVYGESPGQIGGESGETYWQAMDAVYRSCFKAIKPGGVIVLVVKDYVKNKERVRLCDDTCRLLTHIGFTEVERIHAMLVNHDRHGDLFTGHSTKTTSRKSFFRRLAEKKGSPKIDWEEVLIFKKPNA